MFSILAQLQSIVGISLRIGVFIDRYDFNNFVKVDSNWKNRLNEVEEFQLRLPPEPCNSIAEKLNIAIELKRKR